MLGCVCVIVGHASRSTGQNQGTECGRTTCFRLSKTNKVEQLQVSATASVLTAPAVSASFASLSPLFLPPSACAMPPRNLCLKGNNAQQTFCLCGIPKNLSLKGNSAQQRPKTKVCVVLQVPATASAHDMAASLLAFFASLPSPFMPPAAAQVCDVCVPSASAASSLLADSLSPVEWAVFRHISGNTIFFLGCFRHASGTRIFFLGCFRHVPGTRIFFLGCIKNADWVLRTVLPIPMVEGCGTPCHMWNCLSSDSLR